MADRFIYHTRLSVDKINRVWPKATLGCFGVPEELFANLTYPRHLPGFFVMSHTSAPDVPPEWLDYFTLVAFLDADGTWKPVGI